MVLPNTQPAPETFCAMDPGRAELTQILRRLANGDSHAHDQLIRLVYAELRRVATAHMRRERGENSMQPTALVHEAYLKLVGMERIEYRDRAHFFAMASTFMRQILLVEARRNRAYKRGAGLREVLPNDAVLAAKSRLVDIIALDDALAELARFDARKAKIVEMRFFGGLSEEETAVVISAAEVCAVTAPKAWLWADPPTDDVACA